MTDFEPNKLLPGEFAFPVDTGEVYYCVAPGNVKRVATKEELQEILTSSPEAYTALQQLLSDLELNPSELTNILNNIASLQSGKLDKTGDSKDNIVTFAEAETDEDIASGDSHATIFGKILKSIKSLRAAISSKINKSDIVQSAEVADEGKVPSAAVINGLANSITQLNNNLARFMHQTIYLNMVNGVGSITVDGLTNTSFALVQNAQGNNYYVVKTEVSTNTLTVYLNDYASGIMAFNAIIKK